MSDSRQSQRVQRVACVVVATILGAAGIFTLQSRAAEPEPVAPVVPVAPVAPVAPIAPAAEAAPVATVAPVTQPIPVSPATGEDASALLGDRTRTVPPTAAPDPASSLVVNESAGSTAVMNNDIAGPTDFVLGPGTGTAAHPQIDTPFMHLLRSNNAASGLDDLGLTVAGYIQGGYTLNLHRSGGDLIFGRAFDDEYGNAPQLDQIGLSISRQVARDRFDVGGKIEGIYGYDTFRFHSNGLNAYGFCLNGDAPDAANNAHQPRNQFDLTQAYLDLNFEVGSGLLLRLGKFVTPLGYETIDPTSTPFYSRSYLFGFAKPFTNTGALLNYRLDKEWEAWGGVVRGWDQSLNDNNSSVSFLGRLDWNPSARFNIHVGTIWGQEGDNCDCSCPSNDSARFLIDLVSTYAVTERFSLGMEALYGRAGRADANNASAEWYGVAGYASYQLARSCQLNGRLEYFRDQDGTRLLTGQDLEVASATIGLSITPFPESRSLSGMRVQPEVRYDHATTPEFDGGSRKNQITFGIGVLYAF